METYLPNAMNTLNPNKLFPSKDGFLGEAQLNKVLFLKQRNQNIDSGLWPCLGVALRELLCTGKAHFSGFVTLLGHGWTSGKTELWKSSNSLGQQPGRDIDHCLPLHLADSKQMQFAFTGCDLGI